MRELGNEQIQGLIERAIASGDFSSHSDIASRAGLRSNALYRLKKKNLGGVSNATKRAVAKTLADYVETTNGSNKHTNGASNGHANGVSDPASRLSLAEQVLAKIVEVRTRSKDATLCARIDATTARWGVEGLEILAGAALGQE